MASAGVSPAALLIPHLPPALHSGVHSVAQNQNLWGQVTAGTVPLAKEEADAAAPQGPTSLSPGPTAEALKGEDRAALSSAGPGCLPVFSCGALFTLQHQLSLHTFVTPGGAHFASGELAERC